MQDEHGKKTVGSVKRTPAFSTNFKQRQIEQRAFNNNKQALRWSPPAVTYPAKPAQPVQRSLSIPTNHRIIKPVPRATIRNLSYEKSKFVTSPASAMITYVSNGKTYVNTTEALKLIAQRKKEEYAMRNKEFKVQPTQKASIAYEVLQLQNQLNTMTKIYSVQKGTLMNKVQGSCIPSYAAVSNTENYKRAEIIRRNVQEMQQLAKWLDDIFDKIVIGTATVAAVSATVAMVLSAPITIPVGTILISTAGLAGIVAKIAIGSGIFSAVTGAIYYISAESGKTLDKRTLTQQEQQYRKSVGLNGLITGAMSAITGTLVHQSISQSSRSVAENQSTPIDYVEEFNKKTPEEKYDFFKKYSSNIRKAIEEAKETSGVSQEFIDKLNEGEQNNKVYFGINKNDEFNYTGITKQELDDRLYQHQHDPKNPKDIGRLEEIADGLTRMEAKSIENYIIESPTGPNQLNKIRSIGPTNPYYEESKIFFEEFIRKLSGG